MAPGSAACAYALAFLTHKIAGRIRYRRFKGWTTRLPFELVGGNTVLSEKRLFCDLCWTDVSLRVECNDAARPYVTAALRILCALELGGSQGSSKRLRIHDPGQVSA